MADKTKADSIPNLPNLAEDLKDILSKSIEGNLQLLTRVSGMARKAADSVGANPVRPSQSGDIINRLVQLNLTYLSLLTEHGLSFADALATATERALGVERKDGST